jgi:hypothetical protein
MKRCVIKADALASYTNTLRASGNRLSVAELSGLRTQHQRRTFGQSECLSELEESAAKLKFVGTNGEYPFCASARQVI